jgi:hypothetical protein
MKLLYLQPFYLKWHYTRAFKDIYGIWLNLIWFVWHFFSVELLLKSFFSPWHRLTEEKSEQFSFEDLFSRIIVNFLMRVVGAIIRTVAIFMAVVFEVIVIVSGALFFVIWAVLPFLILVVLVLAIRLMLQWN